MKNIVNALPLLLLGCTTTGSSVEETLPAAERASAQPINALCPRSGLPVSTDSLTEYRGHVVGFCNQDCRDDFVANTDARPGDMKFFDAAIARLR